jgi:hypothetical protein
MQIPREAIEKAIEGGWATYKGEPIEFYFYDECRPKWQEIAFDPSFWQALGQTLNWYGLYSDVFGKDAIAAWQRKAHEFYALVLTSRNTEKFWEDLLT